MLLTPTARNSTSPSDNSSDYIPTFATLQNRKERTHGRSTNENLLRSIFIAAGFLFVTTAASAQKWAYVNTQYILENIPEYKQAQQQLDNLSVQWQKEIEDKYAIIDKLYKAYQAEQVLLTEEMKKRRQDEIMQRRKM